MGAILKDIKFKETTVQILSIAPQPRVLISWELEESTQALNRLKFVVDRGESPNDLKGLSNLISYDDLPEFLDLTPRLKDKYKVYYYRVRAIEYDGLTPVQTFSSPVVTWNGNLDLTGLYIVEENEFAYRYIFGTPCLVFKRKREGAYCPNCWDTVLKRVTASKCTTCLGTGKLGGFYKAIEAWVGIEEKPINPHITEHGDVMPSSTIVRFTNYPVMRDGDMIMEAQSGRLWKVNRVDTSEKQGTPLLQLCYASEVDRDDIEHEIIVDLDKKQTLTDQLSERRKEKEF